MTKIALIALLLAGTNPAGLKEHIERLVAQARVSAADFDLKTKEGQEAFKNADVRAAEASGELMVILLKHPDAWAWARPELRKMPAAADRRDLKLRMIEMLAWDPDPTSVKILDRELKADARGIPVRAIIRMDAHGSAVAAKALAAIVKQEPSFHNMEAAIHLGLKGDKQAAPVLEWAVTSGAGTRDFNSFSYGTALACKRLGDDGPWKAMVKRARDQVGKSLAQEDIKTARWYALQLEYYSRLAASKGPIDLLALDGGCASHVAGRMPEVESVEDLHEVLQRCG